MDSKKRQAASAYWTTARLAFDGARGRTDDDELKKYLEVGLNALDKLVELLTAEDDNGLTPTLKAEVAKILAESDPTVQEGIREFVLKAAAGALGDKIIPDRVSGVHGGYPAGIRPVYRPGQESFASSTKPNVPVEFADLVKLDE